MGENDDLRKSIDLSHTFNANVRVKPAPKNKGRIAPNCFPVPQIQDEEGFKEPLKLPGFEYDWRRHINRFDRVYYHHTMASIRKNRKLKQPFAPKDYLDIVLATVYDHHFESFADKSDVVRQPESVGLPTHRLLNNIRLIPDVIQAKGYSEDTIPMPEKNTCKPGTIYHGIKIGGTSVKSHPSSVKLGITSNHGYCTNPGFSRKIDGTYFAS